MCINHCVPERLQLLLAALFRLVSTSASPASASECDISSHRAPSVRRSGSGGAGEIIRDAKRRTVPNFKYRPGGNAPKTITLPLGEPASGTDGSHVVLFVDPALDTLLHLHDTARKVPSRCRRRAAPWGACCGLEVGC
jgi:hypothetical protein